MPPVIDQAVKPIIVTLAKPPSELGTLGRVLLGSLGLAGTLILISVLLAAVFGAAMFWMRSRSDGDGDRGIS